MPFVPTDHAVHALLDSHTVSEAQQLQVALGKLRRASQHFGGQLLAMDPHRMTSYTKRQMRRHRFNSAEKPMKMGQTFFLLDCQTAQPVCFTLASSAQSVIQATPELLRLGAEILSLRPDAATKPLILADKEHYSQELFQAVSQQGCFDLLCASPAYPECWKRWGKIPQARFAQRWPGYATATEPYHFENDPQALYHELVQRSGVKKEDLQYQGFLSTVLRPEVQALTQRVPPAMADRRVLQIQPGDGVASHGNLEFKCPLRPVDDGVARSGRRPSVAPAPRSTGGRLGTPPTWHATSSIAWRAIFESDRTPSW